jgi:hypothetical protein
VRLESAYRGAERWSRNRRYDSGEERKKIIDSLAVQIISAMFLIIGWL